MQLVVLSIHLLVCLCLVGLVLLQRSEGGALGMGGGGGSLMSGRGAADALAKMTSVAGGFFLVTSLSLTFLSGAAASTSTRSVFDLLPRQERSAPVVPPAPQTGNETENRAASTESAAASTTEVAAAAPELTPAAPVTEAPATRAAPLAEPRPTPAVARPQQQQAVRQPAAAQATRPAATTQPRPPATAQRAPAQQRQPLVLPNTSGAGTDAQGESVDTANGVEAVRRERTGPDQ